MVLKRYKSNTLFSMFLKQLLRLAFYIIMETVLYILLVMGGLSIGFILPADYSQNYLVQKKDIISKSVPFDETLIPHTCSYGLFDLDGNYLSGNFKPSMIEEAKTFINDSNLAKHRFFLIERPEGYCIVNYDLSVHFTSATLHKLFPKIELLFLIMYFLVFIMIVMNTAYSFGRKLKKELQPIRYEIDQIQNREINLDQKNAKIKEFNDILLSLNDMKVALSQSLKNEWETEQKRRSNISALAHDIKTPLTIIKGNSELIMEEENKDEIYHFADIIVDNCNKIERYINLLIDETKSDGTHDREGKVNLNDMIRNITKECEALCRAKGIELECSNTILEVEAIVNKNLIERAVVNLVKNAVEHTIKDKRIRIYFEYQDARFIVKVEDFGNGFTKEALKYAKDQFYTEKSERSEEHYGIGMYFANKVAEQYHGRLTYDNKPNHTGAVVTFEITI